MLLQACLTSQFLCHVLPCHPHHITGKTLLPPSGYLLLLGLQVTNIIHDTLPSHITSLVRAAIYHLKIRFFNLNSGYYSFLVHWLYPYVMNFYLSAYNELSKIYLLFFPVFRWQMNDILLCFDSTKNNFSRRLRICIKKIS